MNKFLIILLAWPGFIFSSVFIDVRTPEEHASESIINTYNIEWQNILDIDEVATKDDEIFLFCRSGIDLKEPKKYWTRRDIKRCLILEDSRKPLITLRKK